MCQPCCEHRRKDNKDIEQQYKELIHKFELNPKGMTPKEQELLIKLRQTIYDAIGQKITKRTYGFVHHFAVKLLEKYKRADPITLNQHLFEMYPKTIQIDQHFWFKWTFDSKTGTIHLFEYNNQFGLDSKHPKYIELKEAAISKIKKLSKIYVNSKAIVDSEIIDK